MESFSTDQENWNSLIFSHIQFKPGQMLQMTAIVHVSHHIFIWREQTLGYIAPQHLPSKSHSLQPLTGSSLFCEVCFGGFLIPATRRPQQDYTLLYLKRLNNKSQIDCFPSLITFIFTLT